MKPRSTEMDDDRRAVIAGIIRQENPDLNSDDVEEITDEVIDFLELSEASLRPKRNLLTAWVFWFSILIVVLVVVLALTQ